MVPSCDHARFFTLAVQPKPPQRRVPACSPVEPCQCCPQCMQYLFTGIDLSADHQVQICPLHLLNAPKPCRLSPRIHARHTIPHTHLNSLCSQSPFSGQVHRCAVGLGSSELNMRAASMMLRLTTCSPDSTLTLNRQRGSAKRYHFVHCAACKRVHACQRVHAFSFSFSSSFSALPVSSVATYKISSE
jgi:hypothetical protein